MKSKEAISKQFKKHKSATVRDLSAQYDNTRKCQAFYDGDFMNYEDKIAFVDSLGKRKRAMVQFNKVKPNVNAVGGFMTQNRQLAKYLARVNGSVPQKLFSKYANALKDYVRENNNSEQIETQQDYDMLINGYGATDTDMSYIQGNATTDPNGEVLKVRLNPLCLGWDARAKGKNLIDSRWAYYYEDYDLSDAVSLFQGSEEDDFEKVSTSNEMTNYEYNPYGGRYDKIRAEDTVEWSDKEADMVRVYNYQWFEYETFYRADNPLFEMTTPEASIRVQFELDLIAKEAEAEEGYGDLFTFNPRAKILTFDEKIKAKLLKAFGKHITPVAFKRKAFYTAVISGEHVFVSFRSICQQSFSIQFKTGDYASSLRIWVGMVNSMMEPVKYYNKALTELMFTIASNSKGGVMIERTAVEDVAKFEKAWAKTDATIVVEDGAISGNKIQEKAKAALPTGLESIITLSDASVADCSGVDRAFLGSSENKMETGILFKRKIRQIVSTMSGYMDSVTLYLKLDARNLLDFLRIYAENNDGSMFRIIGEENKNEFAMISKDKLAPEYDVTIQEAPLTPEDKMETAEVLSNMADKLLSAGDTASAKALYLVGVDYLNIDDDAKQKLNEALKQQQQIDPAEFEQLKQQFQLLSSETNKADVEHKRSESALNIQKVEESKATIHQKAADAAKKIEEAQKTDVETDILRKSPIPTQDTATI